MADDDLGPELPFTAQELRAFAPLLQAATEIESEGWVEWRAALRLQAAVWAQAYALGVGCPFRRRPRESALGFMDRLAWGPGYALLTAEGAGALTKETQRLLAAVRQAKRGAPGASS